MVPLPSKNSAQFILNLAVPTVSSPNEHALSVLRGVYLYATPPHSVAAYSIDHTEGPMSEQQVEALRVATRTLDDLADLVEEGLPTLDQSGYDRVIQDVSETDTQFARRWADIKACVDAHLEPLGSDESLDTMTYDYVSVAGVDAEILIRKSENRGELCLQYIYYGRVPTYSVISMAQRIEIDRQQPLEMDSRGRVTIPSNIRQKHGIQPEEGKATWVEVELKWAEIEQLDNEDDGGDS